MTESGCSYKFIREAERDGICRGTNMYAKCPDCGEMVRLEPWERCACGHVAVGEAPGGKCFLSGGTGSVGLYKFLGEPSKPQVKTYVSIPEEPVRTRRFRLHKLDVVALVLFGLALVSVFYAKIGIAGKPL